MADDHAAHAIGAYGSRAELRAELRRLSDEVGDTGPEADPRRVPARNQEVS